MAVKQNQEGKWCVQIDRKGMPRVRKSFQSQQDAERFEREYLLANQKPLIASADQRTLLELIGVWYRYHGVNLSDGVARLSILEQMANDLGNIPAINLTPEQFLEYRFNCTHREVEPVTAKTINNRHGYLAAVYRRLRKLKIIHYECPIAETDMIKIHERMLGYLSVNQINKLFSYLKASRNESVWWIAQVCIRTGARWGEAETLRRKQLHNGKLTFEFTKSKKIRTVPLDPIFYADLLEFTKYKNPDDRIFIDARKQFGRIADKSGINLPAGQSTHVLRHSFASYFIMNGGNILTLQKILGHSDIKMTMRYAHLAPDHLLDAVKFNPMASL
ncbi:MAG: tyrosine-type recombinase/integrase [Methylococcales bacterium]|nr:tyrosine-type recombinase/integrase [Methylococcaceae bacterium]